MSEFEPHEAPNPPAVTDTLDQLGPEAASQVASELVLQPPSSIAQRISRALFFRVKHPSDWM